MRFLAVTLFSLAATCSLAAQQPADAGPPQSSVSTAQTAPPASLPNPPPTTGQPSAEAVSMSSQPTSQPALQAQPVPATMPPGTSVVPTETPKDLAQARHDFEKGV